MGTKNLTVSGEGFTSDIPNLRPNIKGLSPQEAGEVCRKVIELLIEEGKTTFSDIEKPFLESIKSLLEAGAIDP